MTAPRSKALIQALTLVLALTPFVANAQAAPKTPPATEVKKPDVPAPKPGDLKKYEDVITKEAKSQTGLFKVDRIEDKVYWEIPVEKLGTPLLWETEIAQMPSQLGFPGTPVGTRVVEFTRRNNKIFMRGLDYSLRAEGDEGTKTGVEENSIRPILMSFDVQAEGPDKAAVIDVTSLFTSDPQDFAVKGAVGAGGVDSSRSYIDRVKAFPKNIETRSFLTLMMGAPRFNFFGGTAPYDASTASIIVHYSIDELPKVPMMGRYKDSRIGYFTNGFTTYGRPENRSVPLQYINRFRLEKKNPEEAVSEPVQPIVFYLAREVPVKWRPYLKKAIEDWQPAFEQAGFKNAIIAKDAPTVAEDPNWDAEDLRYSVIRWAPSTTENAQGPSVQDPRSGETISAHVIVWNDIVKLVETWYFSQAAGTDPKARQIPMSDELIGSLMRYVVAHEVGHTLGLEHNFRASTAYTVQQLRDPAFTKDHGVAASIMSYSRYNYVTQPGDGVTSMIGMVGPYDKFAIEYGYKPIAGARTPDEEKSALDVILSRQIVDPYLRFGNYKYSGIDPTTQNENISNDPVEAGRLGLVNIDRIARNYLIPATVKFGEDYDRLQEFHGALVQQWATELFHVVPLIGGVVEYDNHAGRGGGDIFRPIPAARQAAAVKFLLTGGMKPAEALFAPEIMNKIQPVGQVTAMTSFQSAILSSLLSESRVRRVQDIEAEGTPGAYTVARLLDDINASVWSELSAKQPVISMYRRTLQRAFLTTLDGKINGGSASKTDLKPLARQSLRTLADRIDATLPHVTDRLTKAHLVDCRQGIHNILNGNSGFGVASGGFDFSMFGINIARSIDDCWGYHLPAAIQEMKDEADKVSHK